MNKQLNFSLIYFVLVAVSGLQTAAPVGKSCVKKIGLDKNEVSYETQICRMKNLIDITLNDVHEKLSTYGKESIQMKEDMFISGQYVGNKMDTDEDVPIYFSHHAIVKVKEALSKYIKCLKKARDDTCQLPQGVNLDVKTHKFITVDFEEQQDGSYKVTDFNIKSLLNRRRRSDSTPFPAPDCKNINAWICYGIMTITPMPRMKLTTYIKMRVKKVNLSIGKVLGKMSLSNNVPKRMVIHTKQFSTVARKRRSLQWVTEKPFEKKVTIPKSLDTLLTGISALV